ncbi:MAG TPA: hypothetical protein VF858_02625 [Gemmatimonadaceae bacterium]
MTSSAAPVSSRVVMVGGLVWLAGALALGATGAFAALPFPVPQIIVFVLTVMAITVSVSVAGVRVWVDSISMSRLVGIHAVRFIGAVFLVLAARGALSPVFAARAGWGDIIAAAGAVVLALSGPPRTSVRWWTYLAWNTFGVLDLVVAVGTATIVVFRGDIPGMAPITRLPLVLVPTLFVPVLFAAHVAIYRRLMRSRGAR